MDTQRDGLTGLLLRGQYEEDFKTFKQNDLCVVYFDINNLKKTNDSLGHRYGDKLILAATDCLKSQFREENIYRTGGDEFIILANGIGPGVIENRLKAIADRMNQYTKNDPDGLIYQIAAGYCVGDGIMTKQEIEETAESRMYQNKQDLKAAVVQKPQERTVISDEAFFKAREALSKGAPVRQEQPKVSERLASPIRQSENTNYRNEIPLVDKYIAETPIEPFLVIGALIFTFAVLTIFLLAV